MAARVLDLGNDDVDGFKSADGGGGGGGGGCCGTATWRLLLLCLSRWWAASDCRELVDCPPDEVLIDNVDGRGGSGGGSSGIPENRLQKQ